MASRCRKEQKEEVWKYNHSLSLADAQRQLAIHEEKFGQTSEKLVREREGYCRVQSYATAD